MFLTLAYGRINHTMPVIATTSVSIKLPLYDFLQILRLALDVYSNPILHQWCCEFIDKILLQDNITQNLCP